MYLDIESNPTEAWSKLITAPPSPVQELEEPLFEEKGIRLWVKRDDLLYLPVEPNDNAFCGNKWRKLKYNLLEAREKGYTHLATFGGAFSNHLAACAAAGVLFGFRTTGMVRGEPHQPLNETLAFAQRCGMKLQYVDRARYRQKTEVNLLQDLGIADSGLYLLPEGGTNKLALRGCSELAAEIHNQCRPDICAVSCGTGGTMAGIIQSMPSSTEIIGFPALKGDFMAAHIQSIMASNSIEKPTRWHIESSYHFGGYARDTPDLFAFIRQFQAIHGIQLDAVYTGKLFFGVWDMIRKDCFPRGSTICVVHTGGLQGNRGKLLF